MTVATVILFLIIGLVGGCQANTLLNNDPIMHFDLAGYLDFVCGAAVATAVLSLGRELFEDD